ncbi:AsmA family protein [Geobacter sp. SVR]|uniref:DUF748 domain-containing protein n=1 Tax=Geobacter sp. SVR TaxID=2495594 RepID=UPI0015678A5A|nr:AsmA family protein [Geobacter sp. SVR]
MLRRLLLKSTVAILVTCAVLFFCLKFFLATPLAARWLSGLLTDRLNQQVTVAGVEPTAGAIILRGVALANPSGFPAGNLVSARSITIAPEWSALLLGKPDFRTIALEGIRLDLRKDSAGTWNFAQLQRALTGTKTAGGHELFIRQLTISDGSLMVEGQGASSIGLQLRNLSSKGSGSSGIELGFEDHDHGRYRLTGTVRGGKEPAFDLNLSSSPLSVAGVTQLLGLKGFSAVADGKGELRLKAGLRQGLLNIGGSLAFRKITMTGDRQTAPLTGRLDLSGSYDLHTDRLRLEDLSLQIDRFLQLRARGTVQRLRTEREFSAAVALEQADLAALAQVMPLFRRQRLDLSGKLSTTELRIAGNSQGLTSLQGSLLLRNGGLSHDRRNLVDSLTVTLRVSNDGDGFLAQGGLSVSDRQGTALLEALEAPVSVRLSRRLQPLAAGSDNLSARLAGAPVRGRLAFDTATRERFGVALSMPPTAVATLNPLLERSGLRFAAGTARASLQAAGADLRDLHGRMRVQLEAVQGERGSQRFTVTTGTADADLTRDSGHLAVDGNMRMAGLILGGRQGEADFAYRYADGSLVLSNGRFRADETTLAIARLAARLPAPQPEGGAVRYPLTIELTGGRATHGALALEGLNGTLAGAFLAGSDGPWLEGKLDLTAGQVAWQGMPMAAPVIRCTLGRSGATAALGGTLLDGELKGEIGFQPFAPADSSHFNLTLRQAKMSMIAGLVPKDWGVVPSGGIVDGTWSGSYTGGKGLDSRFVLGAGGLTITGSGGRTVVANAGIELTGNTKGQRLELERALATAGETLRLQAGGVLTDPLSRQRQGRFFFSMPRTLLTGIIDPFANVLPRILQEAEAEGWIAADGTLELHDGRPALNGALHLNGVRLAAPAQKVSVTGVEGTLPFSLEPAGGAAGKPTGNPDFSRENYSRLLAGLRATPPAQGVRIARITAGALAMDNVELSTSSAGGLVRVDLLGASFYGGSILGRGMLAMDRGLTYRGDFLINGFSLKRLCREFPGIDGYISGLVDGIVGLSGKGSDKAAWTGFLHLWAREEGDERMLISKEFLQRLSGQKLSGFFFRDDRPYDRAEIRASLKEGFLSFDALDILHTNLLGVKDLNVGIAPAQNRIALDHLFTTIGEAATRGRASMGGQPVAGENKPDETPPETGFTWQE